MRELQAPREDEEETPSALASPFERLQESDLQFHKAVGCERCGGGDTGGASGSTSWMLVTDALKDPGAPQGPNHRDKPRGGRIRMTRLRDDGLLKAARGITTIEEVLRTVV